MAKRNPAKAIAEAVKAKKDSGGMVKVYPTEPIGESRVPNFAAIEQEVPATLAEELLAYSPPAFTLLESGQPMPEQKELAASQSEAAWSVEKPEDAADEVSALSPPFEPTAPKEND